MPVQVVLFGIVFHTYGFILGIGVVMALWLIEKRLALSKLQLHSFWSLAYSAIAGGIVGARLWHVATDFYLYRHDLWSVFFIWNGGLSILGGLVGGVGAILLFLKLFPKSISTENTNLFQVFDAAVFGLPFAQAIGRCANWVNQELYGLPSDGLLKIYIRPENRLPNYRDVAYYHPLFLYEALAMTVFGVGLWSWDVHFRKVAKKKSSFGLGKYAVAYLSYYGVVRFLLDFLRIDKPLIFAGMGVNQLVILVCIVGVGGAMLLKSKKVKHVA